MLRWLAYIGFIEIMLAARVSANEPPDPLGSASQPVEDVANEPRLVDPPRIIQMVPVKIPEDAVFPGPYVEVDLEIDVDEQGRVVGVKVAQGLGEPFDSAALQAAQSFEFSPAVLSDGRNVAVTITFRLRIEKPPEPVEPTPKPELVRFEGVLLERGTRKPIAGVEVWVSAEGREIARGVTDAGGGFSFGLPVQVFVLRAFSLGHEKLRIQVAMQVGEQRRESFYLEKVGDGYATVVQADWVRREVNRQIIQKSVVEKTAGTQGDTLKVVQNFPGVARAPFLSGALILRGSSPGDTQIFLEGHEIPILYHFGVLRSTVNSGFLKSVDFIPGNFGPAYGRAMGGVVDVKLRDPANDMFRGEVDVNIYDAGFVLEGPLNENWSMGGAFHRSWVDTFLGAALPDDAPLTFETAPKYYDYQLIAGWKPDASKNLKLIYYGSLDKLQVLLKRPQNDPKIRGAVRGKIMFHNFQLSYLQRITPWLTQESSMQLGYQEFDTQIGPELFFDLRVKRMSARTNWSLQRLRGLTIDVGMDIRLDQIAIDLNTGLRSIEGENPPPISTQKTFAYRETSRLYQPAAYVGISYEPIPGLQIAPGLRLDYYDNIRRWTLDPRLMVRYRVLPQTFLKAGAGLYHQPPTPDQAVVGLGNPDLEAPRSNHTSMGLEHVLVAGLEVELTGFYKWLDQQVVRNPLSFADPQALAYLNAGTGRILGVELLLKAGYEAFSGWLAYTYQRSYRKDGFGATERLFDFDQPHILTLVGNLDLGSGWSVGARFRLVSGRPDTPVVGAVFDATGGVWVPMYGRTNSDRLAVFHQLDLRVDKTWTFDVWKLSLYLELVNSYNHPNVEGWRYNYDYSEREELTGLPILPVLGAKGEW